LRNKLKLINKLFNHNFKKISYFQSDITKFKIFLLVIKNYNENKLQTIEELIDEIPKSISSRAHKLNCITEATKNNYFIKEISKSDQRKKYLKPSQDLIKEFEEYLRLID